MIQRAYKQLNFVLYIICLFWFSNNNFDFGRICEHDNVYLIQKIKTCNATLM